MKKTLSILICFTVMVTLSPTFCVGAENNITDDEYTFWVSPDGDDSNDGQTESTPWKTLSHAAQKLVAGQTAIFKDGTYNETQPTVFETSGRADAPITIKAQNKHKAIIVYSETCRHQKLNIDASYINVRDFAITQKRISVESDSYPNLDILLDCGIDKGYEIEGCEITGNMFGPAFEEGIKVKFARNVLVRDNIIDSPLREGIDVFGCSDVVLCKNKIINSGRTGILVKGNSRNCLVYNNYVYNDTVGNNEAYVIGGQSDSDSPYIVTEDLGELDGSGGYEIYNSVFYNNIAYSKIPQLIGTGFAFSGAYSCHAYNNLVYGARTGFSFSDASDSRNGWAWDPKTVNPVLYNNVIMNVQNVYNPLQAPVNITSDYNAIYNWGSSTYTPGTSSTKIPWAEENSIIQNSLSNFNNIVNDAENGDFTIFEDSPLTGSGAAVPAEVDAYDGIIGVDVIQPDRKIAINLVDYNEEERKIPWDMGVYNTLPKQIDTDIYPVLDEDFTNGTVGDSFPKGSDSSPAWNDLYSAYDVTRTNIHFAADPDDSENPVVELVRTVKSIGDRQNWHYVGRRFSRPYISGGFYNVKFRMRSTDEDGTIFQFNMWDGTTSTPVDFNFNTGEVTVYSWIYNDDGAKINNDITVDAGLTHNVWYDVDIEIDLRSNVSGESVKISVFIDKKEIVRDVYLGHNTSGIMDNRGTIGEISWLINNRGNASIKESATVENPVLASFMIDDIVMIEVDAPTGNPTVRKITLSDDLKKADVEFNHKINTATLQCIMLNDTQDNIRSIMGEDRKCTVEFKNALSAGFVDYKFSFEGVKDVYGTRMNNVKRIVTTRGAIAQIGAVNFYQDSSPDGESLPISKLTGYKTGDSITAAFEAINESIKNISTALIVVQKGADGKMKAVTVEDTSVIQQEQAYKSATLVLKDFAADDTVDVYLWNSLQQMIPIAEGKRIPSVSY